MKTQLELTAKSWSQLHIHQDSRDAAYQAFMMGWAIAAAQAKQLLLKQHEGCQEGTLVSYAIAAEVLELDLKEYASGNINND